MNRLVKPLKKRKLTIVTSTDNIKQTLLKMNECVSFINTSLNDLFETKTSNERKDAELKYNDGKINLKVKMPNNYSVAIYCASEYFLYKECKTLDDVDLPIRQYAEEIPQFLRYIFQDNQCNSIDGLIERVKSGIEVQMWQRTFRIDTNNNLMCKISTSFWHRIEWNDTKRKEHTVEMSGIIDDLKIIYGEIDS